MYESKKQYQYGTGRRKASIARVRVYEGGTGSITINGRDIDDYFGLDTLKLIVRQPLVATELLGKVDVVCTVAGGGVTGQAGAIRHGISRALLGVNPDPRPENEGAQEVRSQGRPPCASVLEEINLLPTLCIISFQKCPYGGIFDIHRNLVFSVR